jgi:uncharacterized protein
MKILPKQVFFKVAILILFMTSCSKAKKPDDILIGIWSGSINSDVHIYYKISRKWDGSLMGYNGIPEFRLSGLPVENIIMNSDSVHFKEIESNQRFDGLLNRDSLLLNGKYTNLNINASWQLKLIRVDSIACPPRPQTPVKPYPYREEEVVYQNEKAGTDIAGTLTIPDRNGIFPAVLLITGTGQQNRDGEHSFHHPFMVVADQLTRHGVAVLRVDDRGVGGTTRSGPFFNFTTGDLEEDVLAGVQYLRGRKDIDKMKIGLIGHSEGGLIATMLAAERPEISYIVLLASPAGGSLSEGIIRQDSVEARARGANDAETKIIMNWCKRFYSIVISDKDRNIAGNELQQLYVNRTAEEISAFEKTGLGGGTLAVDYAVTPHFKYLLSLNPDEFLKNVKCPVLALMGDKDLTGSSAENLKAIENALLKGKNKNFKTIEFKNLNHSFQTVTQDKDADIEETMSPVVLDTITDWIIQVTSELDMQNQNKP